MTRNKDGVSKSGTFTKSEHSGGSSNYSSRGSDSDSDGPSGTSNELSGTYALDDAGSFSFDDDTSGSWNDGDKCGTFSIDVGSSGSDSLHEQGSTSTVLGKVKFLGTYPLLRKMLLLDREDAVAGFLAAPAVQKAARAGFRSDSMEFRKLDAMERGGLLKADLWHQLVDIREGLLRRRHSGGACPTAVPRSFGRIQRNPGRGGQGEKGCCRRRFKGVTSGYQGSGTRDWGLGINGVDWSYSS